MISYRESIQPTARLTPEAHTAISEYLAYTTEAGQNAYAHWAQSEQRKGRPFGWVQANALRRQFRAVLGHDAEQELFTAFLSGRGYKPCTRCRCTGDFVWGTFVNGRPTKRGPCYACEGRGYITPKAKKAA